MFTGAAVVSGAGDGNTGMLEGLIIEKLNGWDIEKRYHSHMELLPWPCCLCLAVTGNVSAYSEAIVEPQVSSVHVPDMAVSSRHAFTTAQISIFLCRRNFYYIYVLLLDCYLRICSLLRQDVNLQPPDYEPVGFGIPKMQHKLCAAGSAVLISKMLPT